jgi:glycine/D-amino acid oxidase-like deaminating enzyme
MASGVPDSTRRGELTRLVMAAQPAPFCLDAGAVRAQVNSPTYLAGLWDKEGSAGVQPARLAWGLADACERIGVRIAEPAAAVSRPRPR